MDIKRREEATKGAFGSIFRKKKKNKKRVDWGATKRDVANEAGDEGGLQT